MESPRLGRAVLDALFVAFFLAMTLSPPDPFAQLLYAVPALVVGLPVAYRYQSRIHGRKWTRHLVLFASVFLAQIVWQTVVGEAESPVLHALVVLVGAGVGAWLAYFGGVERIRASDGATTVAISLPAAYVLAAVLAPDPTSLLGYAVGLLVATVPVTYHFVAGRKRGDEVGSPE